MGWHIHTHHTRRVCAAVVNATQSTQANTARITHDAQAQPPKLGQNSQTRVAVAPAHTQNPFCVAVTPHTQHEQRGSCQSTWPRSRRNFSDLEMVPSPTVSNSATRSSMNCATSTKSPEAASTWRRSSVTSMNPFPSTSGTRNSTKAALARPCGVVWCGVGTVAQSCTFSPTTQGSHRTHQTAKPFSLVNCLPSAWRHRE